MTTKRSHVLIPEELTIAVDKLVGTGKRSRFISEAVKEKLDKIKLFSALEETAGALQRKEHPEWETSQDVAKWVKNLREEDKKRFKKIFEGER